MRVIPHISGFWLVFGVFGPLRGPGRPRGGCFTSTPPPGAGEPGTGSRTGLRIPEGFGGRGPGDLRDMVSDPGGDPSQAPRRGPGDRGARIQDLGTSGVPESRTSSAAIRARGVLHQPLAPGPCPRIGRIWPGDPSRGSRELFPADPSGSKIPFFQKSPPEGYRAPPRGVDVKGTPPEPCFPKRGPPGPQILKTSQNSGFD